MARLNFYDIKEPFRKFFLQIHYYFLPVFSAAAIFLVINVRLASFTASILFIQAFIFSVLFYFIYEYKSSNRNALLSAKENLLDMQQHWQTGLLCSRPGDKPAYAELERKIEDLFMQFFDSSSAALVLCENVTGSAKTELEQVISVVKRADPAGKTGMIGLEQASGTEPGILPLFKNIDTEYAGVIREKSGEIYGFLLIGMKKKYYVYTAEEKKMIGQFLGYLAEFLAKQQQETAKTAGGLKPEALEAYRLTGRECEVLEYVARGYEYKEIACHLGLSVHTIESYRKRIFKKCAVSNKVELLRLLQ